MRDNHTSWENLSTPALEKLLSAEFLSEEDTLSPEELHEISEVIAKREMEDGTQSQVDVDNAWEAFLARVKDLPPEETPVIEEEGKVVPFPKPPRSMKKLRWAVAAAVVLCVLVVPASASGMLEDFTQWASETFSLSPTGKDLHGINDIMYDELEARLGEITDATVLPKWYPKNSILEGITTENDDFETILNAEFSLDGKPFYFTVTVVDDIDSLNSTYEKNLEPLEKYVVHDIPHYIMGNYEQNLVVWRNGNAECCISGELSVEDLKAMVDSIYS